MLVVAVPPAHPPSCLQMVELRTTEMANSDLEKYHKVLLTVLPPYCGFLLLLVLAGALLAPLLALLLLSIPSTPTPSMHAPHTLLSVACTPVLSSTTDHRHRSARSFLLPPSLPLLQALERALLSFHTSKMADINKIVKELWQKTYRNSDIDYIQVGMGVCVGGGGAGALPRLSACQLSLPAVPAFAAGQARLLTHPPAWPPARPPACSYACPADQGGCRGRGRPLLQLPGGDAHRGGGAGHARPLLRRPKGRLACGLAYLC